MNKANLFFSIIFFLSLTYPGTACTFTQHPTEPYISGLTLTNDPNIVITSIIYSDSNHKDLILDLQNKSIRNAQNETSFDPNPDLNPFSINYNIKFSNTSGPLIYSVSLYNKTQLLLNVTMDSIGMQANSLQNYLVSKKYNRFYLFNFPNESISMDINHPVEDHNKIIFTNLDYFGLKFNVIYDNSCLLYSGGGMQTTCLGNYYYGYNKTNIWGIDRIDYSRYQSITFDPRISSILKIDGFNKELVIRNIMGTILDSWDLKNNLKTDNITSSLSTATELILISIFYLSIRKINKEKKV